MYLHNDTELFDELIYDAERELKIPAPIIEKDYFVTLFLRKLVDIQPDIIFKGGTSLSKCYKLIKRFSEDIDLNVETLSKPTEGERKNLKNSITTVIGELGFRLANSDDIKSRRDFNKYLIEYPSARETEYLKQHLIVETAVFMRAYPNKRMKAASLIFDHLTQIGQNAIIEQYGLQPFELNVQTAERTLIDKVFALCDYHLTDTAAGHSRHIYDLYKLLEIVELNGELKALAGRVREERKAHKACPSAKDEVNIPALLQEIRQKETYKKDYENVTASILFEPVSYEEAVSALDTIIESDIF